MSRLEEGRTLEHEFAPGFGAYFFLIEGEVSLNGERLTSGDAAPIREEKRLAIEALQPSDLIMVEVRA